jgi:DNA-binding LytR/AlgR family response regulator
MPRVYASVAVVQLLMLLVMRKEWKPAEKKEVAVEVAAEPPAAAPAERPGVFWQRIPAHLGNELLAVTSEDHYLRIHTSAGSDLVLMRMGDAVTELASEDGMQVHRSWWVKRSAVVELRRSGARMELVLANGVVVPVSRSSQAAVRTAAWPSLASPSGQECV